MRQKSQTEIIEDFTDACRFGWLDDIQEYIKQGGDIQVNRNEGLFNAINCNEDEVVRLLIEHGADIHLEDDFALAHFAAYGDNAMVRFLLDHGANIHAQDDYAVRMAAQNGHADTFAIMVVQCGYVPDGLTDDEDNKEILEIVAKTRLNEKLTKRLLMSQSVKATSPNRKI